VKSVGLNNGILYFKLLLWDDHDDNHYDLVGLFSHENGYLAVIITVPVQINDNCICNKVPFSVRQCPGFSTVGCIHFLSYNGMEIYQYDHQFIAGSNRFQCVPS
jgi:hypothetical protein